MTTTYAALLRGINVGGRRRVPMADLRALLGSLELRDVATYVQSGNVVFASDADELALRERIETALLEHFGFEVGVLLRDRDEMVAIAEAHPFADRESDPARLHVVFLAAAPPAEAAARLDAERFAPDAFVLDGRDLYVHFPNGAGRSKFTLDVVERAYGTTGTGRNWRTVEALLGLMQRLD